ncbi:MAG: DUF3987 domain-containing protein [Proteobacteria bacterium]|nr:DUF3987 domain-containing protein [Pseudomonadota bacterium]
MLHEPVQPPPGYVVFDEPGMEWPEIDPTLMDDGRGVVPEFPIGVLSPEWNRWVCASAEASGAPVDYVAQSLLAAVSALCGAGVMARVSAAWAEPLVLWQALVGWPSSGKSPALAATHKLLEQIEELMRARDGARCNDHQARSEQAQMIGDKWRERCAAALADGKTPPPRPLEAHFDEVYVPSQIVVGDATLEALADVVSGNPRGVIMWRDELAAWLANLGRYANGGSDRAHWLEAWAAAGITVNRRSRNRPLHLRRFPVSVIGSIQPDRIAEALSGSDDGMAARFLYAWPDAPPYCGIGESRLADDDSALARLQGIAGLGGGTSPLHLSLDHEAFIQLDDFLRDLHARLRQSEGLEAGWLGKGKGTVVRLAAILTVLGWSEQGPGMPIPLIGRDALSGAIDLWHGYFWPHARTVFTRAGRTERDREARKVVRWLRQNRLPSVTRQDLRRDALSQSVDAAETDRIALRLEDFGVLRRDEVERDGRGRPLKRWLVNPRLRG